MEAEGKMMKDQCQTLRQLHSQTEKVEDLHIEELKKKYRKIMDKHVDSYGREFNIKFGTDDDLAKKHLIMTKEYYLNLGTKFENQKINSWDSPHRKSPEKVKKLAGATASITNRTVQGQDMITSLKEQLEEKQDQIAQLMRE